MANLRFITKNPVFEGQRQFADNKARTLSNDSRAFNLDAAQSSQNEDQARADVIGQEIQRQGAAAPNDPGAAFRTSLAGTGPAGATMALNRSDAASAASSQEEDRLEELAITAAAKGDDVTYKFASRKLGSPVLPPDLEGDLTTRATYARAALIAKDSYEGNPAQAQQFVQAYMLNGGDMAGAFAATGVPRDKPNLTVQHLVQNGEKVMAFVDANQGTVQVPTNQSGQPFVTDTLQPKPQAFRDVTVLQDGQPVIGAFNPTSGGVSIPTGPGGQAFQTQFSGRTANAPKEQQLIQYLMTEGGMDQQSALNLVFSTGQKAPQQMWAETYKAISQSLSMSTMSMATEDIDQRARFVADTVSRAISSGLGASQGASGGAGLEFYRNDTPFTPPPQATVGGNPLATGIQPSNLEPLPPWPGQSGGIRQVSPGPQSAVGAPQVSPDFIRRPPPVSAANPIGRYVPGRGVVYGQ